MDPQVEKKIKKKRRKNKFKLTHGSPKVNIDLPTDILLNILCLNCSLPAESVLQWKLVCKTWRSLLSGTYFANMHLRRRRQLHQLDDGTSVCLGLLFSVEFFDTKNGAGVRLYNIEEQYSFEKLKMINHPPLNQQMKYDMVGSCNGLVCLTVTNKRSERHRYNYDCIDYSFSNSPVYIFNPITREYAKLPRFKESGSIVLGFGYHSFSNEYKVVRIYYSSKRASTTGQVQVYTLGDGSGWRNKGEIKYDLRGTPPSVGGTLVNGSLHWLDYNAMKIVAFDLSDEEFREVKPRPFFPHLSRCHLRELGGYLCVVYQKRTSILTEMWFLKNNTCNINGHKYHSWIWRMEFSIEWASEDFGVYDPFALTKGGEVLVLNNQKILYRYDPKTKTLSKIDVYHKDDNNVKYINAIPHMNSLVSLNSLGERCRRRIDKFFLGKDNQNS